MQCVAILLNHLIPMLIAHFVVPVTSNQLYTLFKQVTPWCIFFNFSIILKYLELASENSEFSIKNF